jgi:hypothetical protein
MAAPPSQAPHSVQAQHPAHRNPRPCQADARSLGPRPRRRCRSPRHQARKHPLGRHLGTCDHHRFWLGQRELFLARSRETLHPGIPALRLTGTGKRRCLGWSRGPVLARLRLDGNSRWATCPCEWNAPRRSSEPVPAKTPACSPGMPRDLNDQIPESWDLFLRKALSPSRDRRFRNAQEMLDALGRAL